LDATGPSSVEGATSSSLTASNSLPDKRAATQESFTQYVQLKKDEAVDNEGCRFQEHITIVLLQTIFLQFNISPYH
jgi:hypothetical protein